MFVGQITYLDLFLYSTYKLLGVMSVYWGLQFDAVSF